jgi:hypothetical protein
MVNERRLAILYYEQDMVKKENKVHKVQKVQKAQKVHKVLVEKTVRMEKCQ